jgi:hypothetical protein
MSVLQHRGNFPRLTLGGRSGSLRRALVADTIAPRIRFDPAVHRAYRVTEETKIDSHASPPEKLVPNNRS